MTDKSHALTTASSDPTTWSAVQTHHFISKGALSPAELIKSYIDRIKARNPIIKAWIDFNADIVLSAAQKKSGTASDPLNAIPIGIKDVIDTADFPTQMGSPIYKAAHSLGDAAVVSQLRAAGGLILGKTATCEFAGMAPAETLNPLNHAHTPGGSSSGSAAAIADFMTPVALGTQTGGSIIRPSSYCGIIGYKPTFNTINRQGLKFAAETFDTIGVMARHIQDIRLVARLFTHIDETSAQARSYKPLRIGICQSPSWHRGDDDTAYALSYAAQQAEAAGAHIEEFTLPSSFDDIAAHRDVINNVERSRSLHWEATTHMQHLSVQMAEAVKKGWATPHEAYIHALQSLAGFARQLNQDLARFDFILTPAVNGAAPKGLHHTGDPSFQAQWTCLHVPTLSLPCIKNASHMPVGIQLVAPLYHDARLIDAAEWMITKAGLDGQHIRSSQG
jgi:Asp-tRNA(Asn)/Glu-tRNA(Gln) amidotransferase A subunit family amidase